MNPQQNAAAASGQGSLRGKTAALFLVLATVILLGATAAGSRAVDAMRNHYGSGLALNHTLLTRQRILTLLDREVALSQRLAGTEPVRDWLLDETNPDKQRLAIREAEGFRRAFADGTAFVISANSGNYYFGDGHEGEWNKPRYRLDRGKPDDAWFYTTLDKVHDYAINVDVDTALHVTKLWVNVIIHDDGGKAIGLAGSAVDLSRFLKEFVVAGEPGVTTMIVGPNGAIQAHPDASMIEYNAPNKQNATHTLFNPLADDGERDAVKSAMQALTSDSAQTRTLAVHLSAEPRLLAMSYIPGLQWYEVTALDLHASEVLDRNLIVGMAAGGGLLLLALLMLTTIGFDRLVLRPLGELTQSVRAIAAGHYDVRLQSSRRDELGELTNAFDAMAQQVRRHTDDLEARVAARTDELRKAHTSVAEAHRKITDSIRYASLIQGTILPERALAEEFPGECFTLWWPRDVVGGDIYLFHSDGNACLLGVIDCAGHGVPGAFMAMVAHAVVKIAIAEGRWHDPAEMLQRADQIVRAMLPQAGRFGQLATNMDMSLCHVDPAQGVATYAGAKLSMFWSDGTDCHEIDGNRRAVNDNREAQFENQRVALEPGRVFYLVTDGLLDQTGGERGFSFGRRRFQDWMKRHAHASLPEQRQALIGELDAFRGQRPQLDDITVLAFRVDRSPPARHAVAGEA